MKHKMIRKTACFLKNILQVLTSAIAGWVSAWWFLYAAAFLTDKPDRAEEVADMRISGWVMLVTGIITIAAREIIMYRINMDWKRYILFSIVPFVITAAMCIYNL